MPELPEVETTVRGLAQVMDGRRLARVTVRRPDLRRPFPKDLGQRLTGGAGDGAVAAGEVWAYPYRSR